MNHAAPAIAPVIDFVIDMTPTVAWPVTVLLPVAGGKVAPFRFSATVRVFSEREYEQMLPAAAADTENAEDTQGAGGRTLADVLDENARELPRHILDWDGVRDIDGKPLAIDVLPETLRGPYGPALSKGLWRAVMEVRYGLPAGQPGANLGNSSGSPDGGPRSAADVLAGTS